MNRTVYFSYEICEFCLEVRNFFGYIRISQTLKYAKYLDILRLDRISGLRKSVDFCSIVQGAKDAL